MIGMTTPGEFFMGFMRSANPTKVLITLAFGFFLFALLAFGAWLFVVRQRCPSLFGFSFYLVVSDTRMIEKLSHVSHLELA